MNFVLGRKRLVISLISERPETSREQYPAAYAASDRELARLKNRGAGTADRIEHDVHRIMHGAGWVR